MKTVNILFKNLPPQPRNATHEKTKFGIRLSDMAKAFQDDIRGRLECTGRRNLFSDCENIVLSITIFTPVLHFLTRDGRLSKTSIDLDAHKLFVDEVAKYFGFNDGLIWDLNVVKLPIEGDEWCFKVQITGEEKPQWHVFNIASLIRNLPGFHILS